MLRTSLITAVAGLCCLAAAPASKPVQGPITKTIGESHEAAPGVLARPVSFDSPSGHRVSGEWVRAAQGPVRGSVLFVHWLGAPATTNHTEFEADAVELAKCGVGSLLIDAMWSEPGWIGTVGATAEHDRAVTAGQVQDIHRSLDVLIGDSPGRAPTLVVGHDFGAMFSVLEAASDHRAQGYVLMAANPTLADWYRFKKPDPEPRAYRAALAGFDIMKALGRMRGHVLLQYADKDFFIPDARARAFMDAAPRGTIIKHYATTHALGTAEVRADRMAWMKAELGCKG